MLQLGISGVCGKMGRRIATLAAGDPDVEISFVTEQEGTDPVGKSLSEVVEGAGDVEISSDLGKASPDLDCVIEFTLPEPTLKHVEICRDKKIPMVIGTTGIDAAGEEKIKEASSVIPIVYSPNMAPGVNLLFDIVGEAARVLGGDFNMKVDETHHVHKKDSPSGTAKMIAKVIKEASGIDAPVEAFREGEVIGNHGIVFDGEFENIEIRHDAKSRDVFADGSIKAAKFLSGKGPGLYAMAEVLGLKGVNK